MHLDTGLKSVISPINFNGRIARQVLHSSSGSLATLAMLPKKCHKFHILYSTRSGILIA